MRTEYSTKQTFSYIRIYRYLECKTEHIPMVFVFLVYPMQIAQKGPPLPLIQKSTTTLTTIFYFWNVEFNVVYSCNFSQR